MAEPRWAEYGEEWVGDGNTDGKPDTMNRAAKDFYYDLWSQEHDDDGTHVTSDFLQLENGTYTLAASGVVSLTNTSLQLQGVLVARPDTATPVIRTTDMTGTKVLGETGFQTDVITDLTVAGQFIVGNASGVTASGVTFDYLAWGTGT